MPSLTNGTNLNGTTPTNDTTNGLNDSMANASLNGNNKKSQRKKMDRKKSSPMMPAFMVSAPGKVIAFGEHAVVHGKVCSVNEKKGLLDEVY